MYGVKGVTSPEAEQVNIETLCALRCDAAAEGP